MNLIWPNIEKPHKFLDIKDDILKFEKACKENKDITKKPQFRLNITTQNFEEIALYLKKINNLIKQTIANATGSKKRRLINYFQDNNHILTITCHSSGDSDLLEKILPEEFHMSLRIDGSLYTPLTGFTFYGKITMQSLNKIYGFTFKNDVILSQLSGETSFLSCVFEKGLDINGMIGSNCHLIINDSTFHGSCLTFRETNNLKLFLTFHNSTFKEHSRIENIAHLKKIQSRLYEQGNDYDALYLQHDIIEAEVQKPNTETMTKFCAWIYLLLNKRGRSIGRPFFLWCLMTMFMFAVYCNLGTIIPNDPIPHDIPQQARATYLTHINEMHNMYQCFIHSLQTSLWPIKLLFSGTPPIIEQDVFTKSLSIIQSIISTILFYLFIAGIKIRFKIHG